MIALCVFGKSTIIPLAKHTFHTVALCAYSILLHPIKIIRDNSITMNAALDIVGINAIIGENRRKQKMATFIQSMIPA
jgi:hypothetical protein